MKISVFRGCGVELFKLWCGLSRSCFENYNCAWCAFFILCMTNWFIVDLCMIRWFFLFGFVEILILDVYNIFRSQALNNSWFFQKNSFCEALIYIYFTSICPLSIFWGFWSPFNFLVILFALDSFSLRSLELLCMQLLSLYSP